MTFLFAILVLAVVVVIVTRGSFTALAQLDVRAAWVLMIALAVQILLDVVAIPDERLDDLGFGLLIGSYVLLLGFCVLNRHVTGLVIIGVGVALNALVIALNHGMPTRPMERTTKAGTTIEVPIERDVKHRPERSGDRLRFLSDQIVPPDPINEVLSVGDLVIGAGVIVLCYSGSRRSNPRRSAPTTSPS
jgi:Family of unknown function (DUF5317)